MRKVDKFGIPESSEFIEELDQIYCTVEEKQYKTKLSRKERALIDVYEAIGGIEGEGLHQFWTAFEDPGRILDSFRVIGEYSIAVAIEETRWAVKIIQKGTDEHGHYKFTKEQEKRIDAVEERVYGLFIGVPTKLLQFAKQNRIKC